MHRICHLGFSIAVICGLTASGPVRADPVAEFYRGKTIKITAAAGAGGGFGVRARLLTAYLPKYMPGNPSMIADFMPGAGGRRAASWLYNTAPKDGTNIGLLFHNTAAVAMIRPKGVRYDPKKFNWLGGQAPSMVAVYAWHTAPGASIDGMRKHSLIFGSGGKTSSGYMSTNAANVIAGTRFDVILGYRGTADYLKAIESGEIQAALGDWDSIVSVRPQWVKNKNVIPILQFTLTRHPLLPDVPRLLDFAKNDLEREIAEFDALSGAIGHSNAAPPGVPRERVAALRKAIAATYRDPDFLARAKKLRMTIAPLSAEKVEKYVDRVVSVSPDFIAKARIAFGQMKKPKRRKKKAKGSMKKK